MKLNASYTVLAKEIFEAAVSVRGVGEDRGQRTEDQSYHNTEPSLRLIVISRTSEENDRRDTMEHEFI